MLMKISLIQFTLLVVFGVTASASGTSAQELLARSVTLNVGETELKNILNLLEKQADVKFAYSQRTIRAHRQVSLNVNGKSLSETLNMLLTPLDIAYEVLSGRILLTPRAVEKKESIREAGNELFEKVLTSTREIQGFVRDESGGGLPGVNIVIKGTQQGTITDANGRYTFPVPDHDVVLIFSFVGYVSEEVTVGNRTTIDVSLKVDQKALEEVVVVGYGTQRKVSTTAAVSAIRGEEISNVPVANVSSALTGRIPGLISAQGSGEPGNDMSELYVRGVGTTGNNTPLIIVDGVPRELNRLDPNSIESITVLKDAAAVAPYGVAGANGVILVTTKSGRAGKPVLSYNGYTGTQKPTDLSNVLNSYEYASMRNVASRNANPAAPLPYSEEALEGFRKTVEEAQDADPDKYPNSIAMDLFRKSSSVITGHNLSLSGGSDNARYYIGLGYLYQNGLYGSTHNNKYNLTARLSAKATPTTTVEVSVNASSQLLNYPGVQAITVFERAVEWNPTLPIQFSNGFYATREGNISRTMYATMYHGSRKSDNQEIFSQFSVQQLLSFVKGLSVKGIFNYDPTTIVSKEWTGGGASDMIFYNINTNTSPYTYTPVDYTLGKNLTQRNEQRKRITVQGMLNYQRAFGKHEITGLLVAETRRTSYSTFMAKRSNGILDIDELDFGNPNNVQWGNGGNSNQTAQVGYVYRLGYTIDSRYLLEATGRYDGNYYFAPGRKYGFFPAFSAGWRISEEAFLKEADWLTQLKLRGSWGKSGNLAGSPFQYLNTFAINTNSSYVWNGNVQQGASERLEANPLITWEKANKSNIGLEASLWNNALNLEADFFYERRNNMLLSPANVVPAEYGIDVAQENAGIMANRGVDLTLNAIRKFNKDLRVDLTANFTFTKNKLIQTFENPTTYDDPNRRRTGRPLGATFGLVSEGLFQVADDVNGDGFIDEKDGLPVQTFSKVSPGDIRYKDLNGDGIIDAKDQTMIGYPTIPGIIFSFTPRIVYKSFSLSLFMQGAGRTSAFMRQNLVWPFVANANTLKNTLDYWTPENPDARYPRPYGTGGNSNNQQTSSWWMWDGSYLRIKSAELSYTLPAVVLDKIRFQMVRFYASGQNLHTWSKLKGIIDPERSSTGSNTRGWYYPQHRVISVGMNINF